MLGVVFTALVAAVATVIVPALAVPPPGTPMFVVATAVATGLAPGHPVRNAGLVLVAGCLTVGVAAVDTAVRAALTRGRRPAPRHLPPLTLRRWWDIHVGTRLRC